jgi:hypothetical protein
MYHYIVTGIISDSYIYFSVHGLTYKKKSVTVISIFLCLCSLFLFIGKTMHRKILCSLFLFIGKTMHRKILCSLFLFIGKTTDDMICQAIVASHEPKQSTDV